MKLTNLKINLNKEGVKKLMKVNYAMKLTEKFAKEMIREACITRTEDMALSLHLPSKKLGNWNFKATLKKE